MRASAVPVTLTAAERRELKRRERGAKTAWRDRLRAQIVLLAARDWPNARIAVRLEITDDTARKWRGRFAVRGLDGLEDLPRSGRPRVISDADRAVMVALACQLPAESHVPLARWSGPELLRELEDRRLLSRPVSAASVLRILSEHPVKPWRHQTWIYPRDPRFAEKAQVILDLYQGYYQGEPLRPGDRILSVDAKPSIQARARLHRTLPAARSRVIRYEHEYERKGALALLAAMDVHTGRVFAATPEKAGIASFMALTGQVMARPEYRDAPRVFVVVDNGTDHSGQKAVRRLREAHPNAVMVHTPTHASWLNQVEIFFSIVQKKVTGPGDFPSLQALSQTLLAFVERHNRTARPFGWKYTASDLKDLLRRITEHERQDTAQRNEPALAALPAPPTNLQTPPLS
jgi:hypothetical protein